MNYVRFTIPSLPLSMNALYHIIPSRGPGGRICIETRIRPEARTWKTQAKELMPALPAKPGLDTEFFVALLVHWPFRHKNSSRIKRDAPNLQKLLMDAVSERYRFDDSRVVEWYGRSIDAPGAAGEGKVDVIVVEKENTCQIMTMTACLLNV